MVMGVCPRKPANHLEIDYVYVFRRNEKSETVVLVKSAGEHNDYSQIHKMECR